MPFAKIVNFFHLIPSLGILLFFLQSKSVFGSTYTNPPANCTGEGYPPLNGSQLDIPYPKEDMAAARSIALERHNHWRVLHGASLLSLSDELNDLAQHAADCNMRWDRLVSTGSGENFWHVRNNKKNPFNASVLAERSVNSWYEQYCKGTPDSKEKVKDIFSRVVWKRHTQVGIGISRSTVDESGKKYGLVVALYTPAAPNYEDEKDHEVEKLSTPVDTLVCCRTKAPLEGELWITIRKDHPQCVVQKPDDGGGSGGGGGDGGGNHWGPPWWWKGAPNTFGAAGVWGFNGFYNGPNRTTFWSAKRK